MNGRRGRGKAQKNRELIAAAIRILEEIQPTTVRSVCYRLFAEGLIPSMEKKHTARVSVQLTDARESDDLPWAWIVDQNRRPESVTMWRNPATIFEAAVRQYRKDYWKDQPEWIEVWSEKGTVYGVLQPVLDKYGITFRSFSGFNGATTMHDVAEMSMQGDNALTVLYVGDYDPSGMCMSEIDIPKRLELYGGAANIIRLAITTEDTEGLGLPGFRAAEKKLDTRYSWFVENYGDKCWELDAMSPVMLRDRIEAAILRRLDTQAWNHSIKIERVERESMTKFVKSFKRSISRPGKKYPSEDSA